MQRRGVQGPLPFSMRTPETKVSTADLENISMVLKILMGRKENQSPFASTRTTVGLQTSISDGADT
jgi:hypothetical protein